MDTYNDDDEFDGKDDSHVCNIGRSSIHCSHVASTDQSISLSHGSHQSTPTATSEDGSSHDACLDTVRFTVTDHGR